jgi:REP element-mobilizing transposase RayT
MPNHIHLIIIKNNDANGPMWSSVPTSVSTNIKSFKTLVTKELGYSIWQGKFYDHIIRNEKDYLNHLQYIDENPKKWLLGKDEYYA